MTLRDHWLTVLRDATGLDEPRDADDALEDLISRWSEPHRAYHTLTHLTAMLALLREYDVPDRVSVELAAWFHDAVYDPRRADNEARSATVANESLSRLGVPLFVRERVQGLILATRDHQPSDDEAQRWLLDADLAILGEPRATYGAYAAAIRCEYAWVPDSTFTAGRVRVLQGFLARDRIYQTPELRGRFEVRARENLKWEMTLLQSLNEG